MRYLYAYISLLREAYKDLENVLESDTFRGFAIASLFLIPIFCSLLFFTVLVNAEELRPETSALPTKLDGKDGTYEPQAYRKTMTITWVSDKDAVREELEAYYTESGTLAVGKSRYDDENCTVFVQEPEAANLDWYFRVLGHEVAHCFRSNYHN